MANMNIIQALNTCLKQEFANNDKLLSFGEDCGFFGGVFRVTKDLQALFGKDRVFDTPLTEQGIVGFAIGMAQMGYKPICEIQFADYIFPAYDQIVNEMAKMRYRTAGQYTCSLVLRAPCGGGIHGGEYHSQSPEAQFLHTPGIKVVMPSGPYDAKGLLSASIQDKDPIIFLEPKRIYRSMKEEVPEESYQIPLGKAKVAREGSHLTLIGWSAQHQQNMLAAESLSQEGIEVEVLDLRTLNPLDIDAIVMSVIKTGRCVIAHEAPQTCGFAGELSAQIMEQAFLSLQAPIKRCCGLDTPFPHTLENLYLPDSPRVKQAILETLNY